MGLNTIALSGNLGADAELRHAPSGAAVLSFSLAVAERYPKGNGEWGERTMWMDCAVLGRRAEALAPMLKRGCKVAVSGRVHASTYERDGRQQKRWEVRVDELELMGRPKGPRASDEPMPAIAEGVYDDDVPF